MKGLKVGILFDDTLDRPDGVQQYIKVLGGWLDERGHDVTYLVGQSRSDSNRVVPLARNVAVRGNQNTLSLPLPAKLKRVKAAAAENFDVIHVQMPYNPLLSGRLIKRLPKKTALVGTFHIVSERFFERFGSKVLSGVQSRTLGRFDKIVSVSTAAQAFAAEYFGLESEVIPNAVDLSRFKRADPKDHLRPAKHTVTFLGRLVERKGAHLLLDSLAILKQEGQLDDMVVHICGDGPLREVLESYISQNNLSNNVIMHGFIDESEKADYLASSDFCIFPSTGGESFGIVLVEAMASGHSLVLAGNNQGYATVMDNRSELLFDPKEPQQLARKLVNLKRDRKAYKKLKAWQSERVGLYDIETVGPEIENVYDFAIKNRLAR